jgi:uncharacterized protein (DUF1684 family)
LFVTIRQLAVIITPSTMPHSILNSAAKHLKAIALLSIFVVNQVAAQTYQDDIKSWYQSREKSLTAENGWLNLVGLLWLEDGKNTFGSGDRVNIKFPKGTIPAEAGYFDLKNGVVTQYAEKGTAILVGGKAADQAIIFDSASHTTPVSAYRDLRWTIIKRGSKFGVRLRNVKSEAVTAFKGIEHFPVDTGWKVTATLHQTGVNNISITNVLGQVNAQNSPGKLYFSLNGKEYTLDALEEGGKLFIIFGDETSGSTTYPSGRFLSAEKTTDGGKTVLDFNKAYNPPCAFSDFATCPLPPKQNILPVAVTAGEKNYSHH